METNDRKANKTREDNSLEKKRLHDVHFKQEKQAVNTY